LSVPTIPCAVVVSDPLAEVTLGAVTLDGSGLVLTTPGAMREAIGIAVAVGLLARSLDRGDGDDLHDVLQEVFSFLVERPHLMLL
jgi:hypothetical protein